MLLKTRMPRLAVALVLWGCGFGAETSFHSRPSGHARRHAVDARATDARTLDDGGLDALADAASVEAGLISDTSEDTAADQASEVGLADVRSLPDAGCALLDSIANLPSITFTGYHSLAQMLAYLQAVAAAAPQLAQYKVLGTSKQGRDLGTLTINATCLANPPAMFFNGAHHGDENASAEAVLGLPDYLLRKSASDASVRSLLQSYALTILPVVNPDGLVAGTRENADGADINRDYPYPGGRETDAFKTREALVVKSLQESLGFAGAVAFHSGAEEVLWPWCYTGNGTDDESFFLAAGKKTAAAMGFSIYQQSYDDYPTQGEYIDYAYAKSRTLASTFEVAAVKQPSAGTLAGVVERAHKGALAWAQAVSDRALGRLHALPAGPRPRFPFTAPFDGHDRLE